MVFFIIMQAICVKLSCPHVLISPNLSYAGLNGGPIPFIHFVKSSPWCSQDLSCTHPPMQPGLWRKFLGHHCKSRRNACNSGNHWIRTINCEALSLVEFQWVSGLPFPNNFQHRSSFSSKRFGAVPAIPLPTSREIARFIFSGKSWVCGYGLIRWIFNICICIYVCKDKVTTSGWEREKKRCLHAKLIKGFSQNIAISDNIGIHKAWWGWWGWWGWWTACIQGITLASIFWDSGPVFFILFLYPVVLPAGFPTSICKTMPRSLGCKRWIVFKHDACGNVWCIAADLVSARPSSISSSFKSGSSLRACDRGIIGSTSEII